MSVGRTLTLSHGAFWSFAPFFLGPYADPEMAMVGTRHGHPTRACSHRFMVQWMLVPQGLAESAPISSSCLHIPLYKSI